MALPNARNQYLKTQIETASKEQLVIMLFDGIIRFTEQARKAIGEASIEESHHALMRAQAIIMELICTVDKEKGGEVATNLMSLHAYALNCLIVCNMKKDPAKIDEVQKIYRELREAWIGAMGSLGISSQAGKPVATEPGVKAPAAPAVQSPAPAPATVLAVGSTQIAPPVVPVPAPAQAAPVPAPIPKANVYGMGRTAMLGAMNAQAARPVSASASGPVMSSQASVAAPRVAAPSGSAKLNAMLNAYGAANRSIA